MVEADPDERAAHVERVGHQLEHGGALLEHRQEAPARLQLVCAGAVEERGGAADVERLRGRSGQLEERRAGERRGRRAPARRGSDRRSACEAGACRARHLRAARSDTRSPRRRGPGSTGASKVTSFFATPPVEVMVTTMTTDGWSSSASTCRTVAVSSPGAETSASSCVTSLEHLGRRLQRRLHLALHRGQVEREARRPRLLPFEQLLGVEAVAGSGRDPAGRGVRMREQPERLELRRARSARSTGRRRDRSARRASSSRPARRWPRAPRRRVGGCRACDR